MSDRSTDTASQSRSGYSKASWLIAVGASAVATAAVVTVVGTSAALLPGTWRWLVLVPLFALGEATQIHFEFRRQTVYWHLSEIPMIIGLIGFGLVPSLIGRGIAVVLVQLYKKRHSAPKIVFNGSVALAEKRHYADAIRSIESGLLASFFAGRLHHFFTNHL